MWSNCDAPTRRELGLGSGRHVATMPMQFQTDRAAKVMDRMLHLSRASERERQGGERERQGVESRPLPLGLVSTTRQKNLSISCRYKSCILSLHNGLSSAWQSQNANYKQDAIHGFPIPPPLPLSHLPLGAATGHAQLSGADVTRTQENRLAA